MWSSAYAAHRSARKGAVSENGARREAVTDNTAATVRENLIVAAVFICSEKQEANVACRRAHIRAQ
jgi:hypothetical protein